MTGYSPGTVARRLGVAVTTLRTWHQRYGLGPSLHEAGQHRRYSERDVERLELMQQLIVDGATPSEAARWAQRAPEVPPERAEPRRDGGGWALGDAGAAARGLSRAAARLDGPAVRQGVAAAVAELGVVDAWDRVLRPVLAAVGDRHAMTGALVDVEHLLSGCISAVLGSVPRPEAGVPVRILLACADEEQHSLALEALAAALAEAGVPCRMLGARVPPSALAAAIRRTGPAALLVWSHHRSTADPAQLGAVLADARPLVVAVAGPGWVSASLPAGVAVPTSLGEALALLTAASA